MGILIDFLVIAVMLLCIFVGYKRGLIKVAVKIVAIVLSIIFALIFYRAIASLIINATTIDDRICDVIYEKIKDVDFTNVNDSEKENNAILKISGKYINEAINSSKADVAHYVAEQLTLTIVQIVSFIIFLIIVRLMCLGLNVVADVIGDFPIIKQFNISGGIIYGIIEGFFMVNLVFAVLYILNPICLDEKIEKTIEESKLGNMIYENNVIVDIIMK